MLVVTAKYGTEYLGDLHVRFDGKGIPVAWGGAAERLEPSIPPAPDITARLEPYARSLERFRATVLGEHHLRYADGMDACRSGDCLAGMLQTDSCLLYTSLVQFGLIPEFVGRIPVITHVDELDEDDLIREMCIRDRARAHIPQPMHFSGSIQYSSRSVQALAGHFLS